VLESSVRLLELLSLLQSRREWSGAQLAERLEVGERTIRRDVERLRRLGYPVHATGASLPPLLLDEGEAVAVAVGLRSAASAGVEGIEETSVRALAKLEQLLPTAVRRRVAALGTATVPFPFPGQGPRVDPETLAAIAAAARDSVRLRFSYRAFQGAHSRRLVEPHRLVHNGRRWYLVAWDCERTDWRTFRVDRIAAVPSQERRFEPREPPARDLAAYVARSIAATRDRYQARVLLHAPLAEVSPRVPRDVGALEPIDEHSCMLSTSSDWLGGLAIYVAGIGVDFQVLEPPELIAQIAVLAERFTRATARSG
jgi:predicted DNA-binding transcriptional regulator YafY